MSFNLTNIIFPSATFFTASFLAFAILEISLAVLMNWFVFRFLGYFYTQPKDPRICRLIRIAQSILLLLIMVVMVFCYKNILGVLTESSTEILVFACEFFLAMLLTFSFIRQEIPDDELIKKTHLCVFLLSSSIAFLVAVLLASAFYDDYRRYFRTHIAIPLGIETFYLGKTESRKLIDDFRTMISRNECPEADFSKHYNGSSIVSFVYLLTQPDLKTTTKPLNRRDLKAHTSGRLCSNGEYSFLLTESGRWYWVLIGKDLVPDPFKQEEPETCPATMLYPNP